MTPRPSNTIRPGESADKPLDPKSAGDNAILDVIRVGLAGEPLTIEEHLVWMGYRAGRAGQ